ncbi:MAG: DUF2087 domain-containing protein [Cryobacterium sp.]|nr:DUF2087 domain-containing protein [Cryobacterium sp.]
MSNDWRAIIAALANADTRSVFAEIVLNQPNSTSLSAKKRDRAIATLLSTGLARRAEGDVLELVAETFTTLLATAAEPRREGVDRFIEDGRVVTYPASPAERRAVLEWVANEALTADEVLTEPEVGERLARFRDDVATLRRYLVDEGFLLRTPTGTSYSRAPHTDSPAHTT